MNSHSVIRNTRRISCWLGACILLISGCDKVPTWDELTQGKPAAPPANAQPEVVTTPIPAAPTPVAPVAPRKPDAELVIAQFKTISPGQMTNQAINQLCSLDEGLDQVTEINARTSQVTDEGLASLHKLTSLKTLELEGTTVGDLGCEAISQVPSLESLSLTGARLTEVGASQLMKLPQLKELYIDGTRLELAGWAAIGKMPALEVLSIKQSSIDDRGMEYLCEARTLHTLIMNDVSVTDDGLVFVRKLDVLTRLYFSGCPIQGDGLLQAVKKNGLKTLISLAINHTNLNEKGAQAIAQMDTLEELNMGDLQNLTDKYFAMMVKGKKHLRYLNAPGNRLLTNDSLKAVKDLTNLEELRIGGVGMNNQGLVHLVKLKKLRVVDFKDSQITSEGIQRLQVELPELGRPKPSREK